MRRDRARGIASRRGVPIRRRPSLTTRLLQSTQIKTAVPAGGRRLDRMDGCLFHVFQDYRTGAYHRVSPDADAVADGGVRAEKRVVADGHIPVDDDL